MKFLGVPADEMPRTQGGDKEKALNIQPLVMPSNPHLKSLMSMASKAGGV